MTSPLPASSAGGIPQGYPYVPGKPPSPTPFLQGCQFFWTKKFLRRQRNDPCKVSWSVGWSDSPLLPPSPGFNGKSTLGRHGSWHPWTDAHPPQNGEKSVSRPLIFDPVQVQVQASRGLCYKRFKQGIAIWQNNLCNILRHFSELLYLVKGPDNMEAGAYLAKIWVRSTGLRQFLKRKNESILSLTDCPTAAE